MAPRCAVVPPSAVVAWKVGVILGTRGNVILSNKWVLFVWALFVRLQKGTVWLDTKGNPVGIICLVLFVWVLMDSNPPLRTPGV